MRRRLFYDRLRKFITTFTVFSGVSTISTVLAELGEWPTLLTASLAAFFSTLDLVIGTTESARLHADLAKEFIGLEKDLLRAPETLDEVALREFSGRRLDIESKEPPILRVLDCLCHNELLRALGYPKEEQVKVGPLQRFLSQFLDFRAHNLPCP